MTMSCGSGSQLRAQARSRRAPDLGLIMIIHTCAKLMFEFKKNMLEKVEILSVNKSYGPGARQSV